MARGPFATANQLKTTANSFTAPTRPYTIAAWVYINALDDAGGWATLGGLQRIAQSYALVKNSNAKIEVYTTGLVTSTATVALGQWLNVGFTVTDNGGGGNTVDIYIGGALSNTGTAAASGAPNAANTFSIGYDILNNGLALNGYLAHYAVWSGIRLSATDFTQLLSKRPSLVQSSYLHAYWTLQETSGAAVNTLATGSLAQTGTVGYVADNLYQDRRGGMMVGGLGIGL